MRDVHTNWIAKLWRGGIVSLVCIGSTVGIIAAPQVLRVGYFPNVTHAHGIIGSHSTREGRGWFEERLGPDVKVQWFAFNAGPSAMEAIFAGSIDATYVGPNPALNAYIRSNGDEVRILAGAVEGGAALVVQGDGRIAKSADFAGRRVGTPQLGNTQDVAARAWLKKQGFKITQTGGDVLVVPTANPDQLSLFQQGKLDAVWTVEPWVSRLVMEAGGKLFIEQDDAITTLLVSSTRLLRERPDLAQQLLGAHTALTDWLNEHPAEARELVRAGLTAEARREMPAELVAASWSRMRFTNSIDPAALEAFVADAKSAGFLRNTIPLDRLFSGRP
ncbi:MAG TPA: ABC transporter substrate-binding protein [Opitutaceae bacterium]